MTVYVSHDDAQSWQPAVDVYHGGSAYSSLQVLDRAGCTLGLIFDKDVDAEVKHHRLRSSVALAGWAACSH